MVPFHRFLLAIMVANISNSERLDLLGDLNCKGLDTYALCDIFRSMAEGVDGKLKSHFEAQSLNSMDPEYIPHLDAAGFCIEQNITHILQAITSPSGAHESQAISLVSRSAYWRIMSCLFMAEEPPSKVAEALEFRFKRVFDVGVMQQAYYMFFQYGSMKQSEINDWILHYPSRVKQLLRLSQQEASYVVRDELGLSGDIDLKFVSQRIMARSMTKFELLSRSGHTDAMGHARDWGKLALSAGQSYEKVKGGGFVDFIAQFQIALTEADDAIIEAHPDQEEFE